MAWPPGRERLSATDSIDRGILLPLIYVPILWVGLIHLGTRLMWFPGFGNH